MATTSRDVKLALSVETLGQENITKLEKQLRDLAATGGAGASEFADLADQIGRLGGQNDALQAVKALAAEVTAFEGKPAATVDFVLGNTKARMRMVAQYTIAGATGGLVIGTDHAAEAVMGFFTKFGDGSCDLAPLSGLVKNQVRAIARHFGAPESLVEKVPTADLEDLEPGKPDEASHGVTYAEIDAFLHGEPVSEEAFRIISSTYEKTHHKREMPFAP